MFSDQPDKSSAQRNKQRQQHKERPSIVVLDEGQVGVSYLRSIVIPDRGLLLRQICDLILVCSVTMTIQECIHHSLCRGLVQKEHGEIYYLFTRTRFYLVCRLLIRPRVQIAWMVIYPTRARPPTPFCPQSRAKNKKNGSRLPVRLSIQPIGQ